MSYLSETYLDSCISKKDNNLTLPGYDLYRADRPSNVKRGGGVYLLSKCSSVEGNRHSIPTKTLQLPNENRGKIM